MVDVIKSLGIEYLAANPGTSFRGLHESIINYGKNEKPEFITCTHEELSVGIAHDYAKVEGKPILVRPSSRIYRFFSINPRGPCCAAWRFVS